MNSNVPRSFRAALDQARGQLARDSALLANARLDLKRDQALYTSKAVSQQVLDTQTTLVKQNEGVVMSDAANVESAQINLGYTHITSPVAGRVGIRQVDVGNFVSAGQSSGIVVVTQLQPMSVLFAVPEDNIGDIVARMATGDVLAVDGLDLHVRHEVRGLVREADGTWRVEVMDLDGGWMTSVRARFVFLGAGGAALTLLRKSRITEGHGYGGFPVSGQWLMCSNPEVIAQHHSKVYGKPSLGAPPMSVPHLDTRIIDGEQALLFGPFAGFSTKYLKTGSYLDMIKAIGPGNIWPMMAAGWHNLDLTRYLIGQVLQSPEQRLEALKAFVPTAKLEDWKLETAGQRVQIIKRDPKLGGRLEFGTEVVAAADGTLAALLGASPGASTCAATMVFLILKCFNPRAQTEAWQAKIRQMVPSFGHDLTKEADVLKTVRDRNDAVLGLA